MGGFFFGFSGGVGGRWEPDAGDSRLVGTLRAVPRFPIQLSESEDENPLMLTVGAEVSSYMALRPEELSVDPRFAIGFGNVKDFEILASAGYSYGMFPSSEPLGSGFSVGATIEFTPFSFLAERSWFFKFVRFAVGYDVRMYGSEDYAARHVLWGGLCLRLGEIHTTGSGSGSWTVTATSAPVMSDDGRRRIQEQTQIYSTPQH